MLRTLLACTLLVVSNWPATALPSPPQTNRDSGALVDAQSLLSRGHPEQALRLLTAYIANHPKDVSGRTLLGEAYLALGDTASAQNQYELVLKESPNNYLSLARLGELYQRNGQLEKAEPLLARAVKYAHGEPQLRMEWAAVLARLHRYREASQALAGVTPPASPNDRVMLFRLKAAVAEGLGNSNAAAKDMERALSLQPDDAGLAMATAAAQLHAHNWQRAASLAAPIFTETKNPAVGLVLLEAQLGMRKDVHQTLNSLRSLDLQPQSEVGLRQRIAELLVSHGDFSEAVTDLKRAVELQSGNADVVFDLALAEFKAGQVKEALATAETCKGMRDSGELEDLLGDIEETLGDNLAAVRSYQAAVSLAPKEESYRMSLAVELIRHRNFDAAKVVLKQAEGLFPKSWRVQVGLAMVEYFLGTKDGAARILMHAADLSSHPQPILRYLGEIEMDEASAPDPAAVAQMCGFAKSHPDAAREQFYCAALQLRTDYVNRDTARLDDIARRLKASARSLPDDAGPHCELGRLLVWQEKWKPAQRECELCAKMDPNSAQAHYRLSQVYRHTGQIEALYKEIKLYKAASKRMADQNQQRQRTLKTFLYTIEKPEAEDK